MVWGEGDTDDVGRGDTDDVGRWGHIWFVEGGKQLVWGGGRTQMVWGVGDTDGVGRGDTDGVGRGGTQIVHGGG